MSQQPRQPLSLPASMFSGGLAACIAETATISIDTAKVRLQLQVNSTNPKYTGMLNCLTTMVREEGPNSLFKGLSAGLYRQIIFASLRIGLYEPVRNIYHKDPTRDPPLFKKILAGLTTGAIGITIANPTDITKIRFQAQGRLPPGQEPLYHNVLDAINKIYAQPGGQNAFLGLLPNVMRNSIICAAELATYDQAKQVYKTSFGFEEGIRLHLSSAITAGFVATCVGSPVDVIKTRIMNAGADSPYKNVFKAFGLILAQEGPRGFYKGFIPNFMRIGAWNTVMFLSLEQIKNVIYYIA